jgi:hypothetical protein
MSNPKTDAQKIETWITNQSSKEKDQPKQCLLIDGDWGAVRKRYSPKTGQ